MNDNKNKSPVKWKRYGISEKSYKIRTGSGSDKKKGRHPRTDPSTKNPIMKIVDCYFFINY